MMAAQRGYEAIVRTLLENKAAIDLRGFRLMTALHHAVIHKHFTIATMLLERNAFPNIQMDDGRTPLHYAASCCPEVVSKLLSHGANPNLATPRCTLPLHMSLMALLSLGYPPSSSGTQPRQYEALFRIVDELVNVGSHTGIRTLSSNLSPPRGVSARELVEKSETIEATLKEKLDTLITNWPHVPPMPCTELSRKVVLASGKGRRQEAELQRAIRLGGTALGGTAPVTTAQAVSMVRLYLGAFSVLGVMLLVVWWFCCRGRRGAKGGKARAANASKGKLAKGKKESTPRKGGGVCGGGSDTPTSRGSGPKQTVGGVGGSGKAARRQQVQPRRQPAFGDAGVSSSERSGVAEGSRAGTRAVSAHICSGDDDDDYADYAEENEKEGEEDLPWEEVGEKAQAKTEQRRLRQQKRLHKEPPEASSSRWRADSTTGQCGAVADRRPGERRQNAPPPDGRRPP